VHYYYYYYGRRISTINWFHSPNYALPAAIILMRVQLCVYIGVIWKTTCARCSPNGKMVNKQTNRRTKQPLPATPWPTRIKCKTFPLYDVFNWRKNKHTRKHTHGVMMGFGFCSHGQRKRKIQFEFCNFSRADHVKWRLPPSPHTHLRVTSD